MKKRIILDQRTVDSAGIIHLRFKKEIVEGEAVLLSEYHRVAVEPGSDVDYVLKCVARDPATIKYGKLQKDCVDKIKKTVETEHTPDVVEKYKAAKSAAKTRKP